MWGYDNYTGVTISDSVLKASSQLITGLGSGENLTGGRKLRIKETEYYGNHYKANAKTKHCRACRIRQDPRPVYTGAILVSLVKHKWFWKNSKKSLIYATINVVEGKIIGCLAESRLASDGMHGGQWVGNGLHSSPDAPPPLPIPIDLALWQTLWKVLSVILLLLVIDI